MDLILSTSWCCLGIFAAKCMLLLFGKVDWCLRAVKVVIGRYPQFQSCLRIS